MTPLTAAQAAFRHSPGRETALALMDEAIRDLHAGHDVATATRFADRMQEIRDWLMNTPSASEERTP